MASNKNKIKENSLPQRKEKEEKFSKKRKVTEIAYEEEQAIDKSIVDFEIASKLLEQKKIKKRKLFFKNSFITLFLLFSLVYFLFSLLYDKGTNPILLLIENSLLLTASIFFGVVLYRTDRRRKFIILGSILFILFFGFRMGQQILSLDETQIKTSKVLDLRGMTLTDAMNWGTKNNISIVQDYEYSDYIDEYMIISQDISPYTKLQNVKEITVSISEGKNPYKEVVIPSMLGWDTERVLHFIESNYLTNVQVEFVESEEKKDTLIEQNITGNMKRNDELKLTFSLGEEFVNEEIKLVDLVKKSKFYAEFYCKQHRIRYEWSEDFSKKIEKGKIMSQSIEPSTVIHSDDEKLILTISKGKEVVIPNLTGMRISELTDWVIKNKLKIKITDQYDEKIEKDKVISANYHEGDKVEEGSILEVVLSRGPLKMKKFDHFEDFQKWADKYGIAYEEKHEFHNTIASGEVISYSYKPGDSIKNHDIIIVTISDGKETTVPNLVGMTKKEAKDKLDSLGLKYHFTYRASNTISKDKVISQSISSGSTISSGATISIILSNGEKEEKTEKQEKQEKQNKKEEKTSPSPSPSISPSPEVEVEEETCKEKYLGTVSREMINILNGDGNFSSIKSQLESYFRSHFSGATFVVKGVSDSQAASGSYLGGVYPGDEIYSCRTYTIELAK